MVIQKLVIPKKSLQLTQRNWHYISVKVLTYSLENKRSEIWDTDTSQIFLSLFVRFDNNQNLPFLLIY